MADPNLINTTRLTQILFGLVVLINQFRIFMTPLAIKHNFGNACFFAKVPSKVY